MPLPAADTEEHFAMNDRQYSAVHIGCVLLLLLLTGCSRVYYGTMEKLGYEKRDILVERVEESREAQQEAREQFESALEQFIAATNYEGGDLEAVYRRLKSEYEASVADAEEVRQRIDKVEQVADDLFAEWKNELKQYKDPALRRSSARQLEQTRARYQQLMAAMRRAEKRIDPVLGAFQDRVLYLKHNLNARAIASLRGDRQEIESDIQALIKQMNASIDEANRFIAEMTGRE
jgi:DNA repair exonuclease SbcCD ATPase subunit